MKYAVEVKGRTGDWLAFVPEAAVAEMRADGIEVMEVHNSFPEWLPGWAIALWCAIQDLWNLPSKWGRKW